VVTAHPILVVEDEFLIALDIVAALEDAGIAVAGPASTVSDALVAIERGPLRGALLDAHLAGESAGRIADALAARGLPFAFVSGYGPESLPPAYRNVPLVRKPFTDRDLLAAIARF
jgi:CheY-like chemotaxis protein